MQKDDMNGHNRGQMRPHHASRTPSFIVVGLLVVIAILGFNYWNISTKNNFLADEIHEMAERLRLNSVRKLAIEKRNDALLQKMRETDSDVLRQKNLSERKEEELSNMKTQLNAKGEELDTIKADLEKCKQDMEACRQGEQDLQVKAESCNGEKEECLAKVKEAEECEAALKQAEEDKEKAENTDCTEEVSRDHIHMLQIIQQLFGDKAIISLQQAHIDVSGIKLGNVNVGGGVNNMNQPGQQQQLHEQQQMQQQQPLDQQQQQQQQQPLDQQQQQQPLDQQQQMQQQQPLDQQQQQQQPQVPDVNDQEKVQGQWGQGQQNFVPQQNPVLNQLNLIRKKQQGLYPKQQGWGISEHQQARQQQQQEQQQQQQQGWETHPSQQKIVQQVQSQQQVQQQPQNMGQQNFDNSEVLGQPQKGAGRGQLGQVQQMNQFQGQLQKPHEDAGVPGENQPGFEGQQIQQPNFGPQKVEGQGMNIQAPQGQVQEQQGVQAPEGINQGHAPEGQGQINQIVPPGGNEHVDDGRRDGMGRDVRQGARQEDGGGVGQEVVGGDQGGENGDQGEENRDQMESDTKLKFEEVQDTDAGDNEGGEVNGGKDLRDEQDSIDKINQNMNEVDLVNLEQEQNLRQEEQVMQPQQV